MLSSDSSSLAATTAYNLLVGSRVRFQGLSGSQTPLFALGSECLPSAPSGGRALLTTSIERTNNNKRTNYAPVCILSRPLPHAAPCSHDACGGLTPLAPACFFLGLGRGEDTREELTRVSRVAMWGSSSSLPFMQGPDAGPPSFSINKLPSTVKRRRSRPTSSSMQQPGKRTRRRPQELPQVNQGVA
jgi:hypothetical protein